MRLARQIDTAASSRLCVESDGRFLWIERSNVGAADPWGQLGVEALPTTELIELPTPLADGSFIIAVRPSPRLLFDAVFVGPAAALFGISPEPARDLTSTMAAVGRGLGAIAAATLDWPWVGPADDTITPDLVERATRDCSAVWDPMLLQLARSGSELLHSEGPRSLTHGRCSTTYLDDGRGDTVRLLGWLEAAGRHPLYDLSTIVTELLEGLALGQEGEDVRIAPDDVMHLLAGFRTGTAGSVTVGESELRALVAVNAVAHHIRESERNEARPGRSATYQQYLQLLIERLELPR